MTYQTLNWSSTNSTKSVRRGDPCARSALSLVGNGSVQVTVEMPWSQRGPGHSPYETRDKIPRPASRRDIYQFS